MKLLMDRLERVLIYLLLVLLVAMVLIIGLQVFFRYVLDNSLTWSEEVARYILVWFALLGAAVGIRHYSHIAIDFLVTLLPAKLKVFVNIIGYIFAFSFMAVVAFQGLNLAIDSSQIVSPGAGVPMSIPFSALPIVGTCILLFLIEQIWLETCKLFVDPYEKTGCGRESA